MDLTNLIEVHLDIERLSKDLDDLGPAGRVWAARQWSADDLRILWDAACGFRPVSLDHFVPEGLSPMLEVIHVGKNSLPVASHFEKRFCRPPPGSGGAVQAPSGGDEPVLFGYNQHTLGGITGYGYYVARPASSPGEVDLDYTQLPSSKPGAWPPIASNHAKLGRFIYEGLIDVMRGISSHVSIGRARRGDVWLDNWFVLVRQDPA